MENNTISIKPKNWQECCHVFWGCCKTVCTGFYGTATFTKKLFFYITLLFLGVGITPNSYGQLVGSSAVKANFGIDADVYSDLLQFPNIASPVVPLPSQVATDDWFQTSYPGPGFGVIDQSTPFPDVTDNHAFSRRQSVTTPTAPFPFPIVVSGASPQPYLWLDAVYGRDNYVVGGNAEKSYFAGSGDKNSDNPSTWSIGTSGSVPQKDDILDVYAHLRGEGPRAPFSDDGPGGTTDPRPFKTLYAYAAGSLAVTNGNKHIDFEFFRTALETPADLTIAGKTGPDGGRTAFTFNPDGTIAIPGTIIISIDYTNGGNVPQVRIRVWMDETVFNSFNNSNPLRPFTTVPGTFEKGDSSGNFGYGVITANNNNETYIWGRVNINASTLGPPWGAFAGSGPDPVADYQPLQFVEIGINLTAFGLDKRGTQDPCSNILGSLLVKTRSSGGGPTEGAFGSELKDFAGPFLFGNTGTPPTVSVPDMAACAGSTVDLTAGATTTGGAIEYFTTLINGVYSNKINTPTAYAPGATHIYARSESLTNPGCYGADEFDITVNPNPTAAAGPDQAKCQTAPSGPTSFTLAGTGANGTFAWTQISSTGTASATINSPTSLTSTVSVAGIGTVTLRLTTTSNATPSCGTAMDDVVLTVNANPTAAAGPDQAKCQTAPSGPTSFTLAGTGANGTFAWTQIGSTGTASATINSPTSLTSTVSVAGIGTVTLRLTTTSASCGTATDDVVLTVNANPAAAAGPDQAKCQTAPSGPTSFTLAGTGANGTFAWTQIGQTGTAQATINSPTSLTSTVNVAGIGTVTLRLTTTSASCGTATDDVILTVNANPTAAAGLDEAKCQTAPSGPTSFTLAGSGSNGTFAWTQIGSTGTASATINSPTSLTSTVSVAGIGTVTLRLTTTSTFCGTATDDVVLTVNANPTAAAGPDETKCQTAPSGPTSFTLAGSGANGTFAWTQVGSTGTASATINSPTSLTSTVSVAGIGTVTLRLTTTSNATPSCGTATDEVILTVSANAANNAGPDQAKCQTAPSGPTSFTLAGTASNGTSSWTQVGQTGTAQATIATPSSLTSTVSVAGIGTVTLRLTTTSSCGNPTDDVVLTVNANPTAAAGPDQAKCQTAPSGPTSFTLAGSGANGTFAWTQIGQTGTAQATIATPSSLTSTVSVAGIGTVTLRLTTTSTSCGTATDDVVLTVNANPTAAAGPDEAKCQTAPSGPTSFTLAGSGTNGTFAWTQIGQTGTAQATIATPSSLTSTVSVAGIGTVTLRLTTTSTSCGTATDDVVLTVNANPAAAAGPDQAKCQTAPSGPTSFTLAGSGSNGTFAWTQIGQTGTAQATIATPSSLTSTVSVAGIGTVTLRLTTTSASCGTATDDVVLTVNVNPTAAAGPDQAKCQTAPSGPTSFTLAGSGTNGTFAWTQIGQTGTAQATINSPTSLTSTVSVAGIGTVTLRLTTTSTSCGTATDDVVLTVNANPVCDITGEQTVCSGVSSTFTATAGMSSYAWTGPNNFSATTPSINVSVAGVYSVTITNANGCQSTCSRELIVEVCGGALCTYTQGYYGNVGGMSCVDGEMFTTKELIAKALASYGGTMTIGSSGNTVTIMNNMTDINALIQVMPGGGGSYVLSGSYSINNLPSSYLKKGRINNTLLAQTIALGLNIGINGQLGNFELQGGTIAIATPEGGCGSDVAKVRSCNPDGTVNNEYKYYAFPANVVSALGGNPTVQGLYALANQALGGGSTNGLSLSEIASAVDLINNAFDECRIFVGYNIEPLVCPVLETSFSALSVEAAGFIAYPVPVDGQLSIQCTFGYTSDVTIEVFDSKNQMVYTKTQAQCSNGTVITLDYNFNSEQQQVFYIRLTTSQGSTTHDVISAAK